MRATLWCGEEGGVTGGDSTEDDGPASAINLLRERVRKSSCCEQPEYGGATGDEGSGGELFVDRPELRGKTEQESQA